MRKPTRPGLVRYHEGRLEPLGERAQIVGAALAPCAAHDHDTVGIVDPARDFRDIGRARCKLRPWLQDFDDYQSRALPYGVKEINAQRQGNADAGGAGWMLWNAGGKYTEEGQ